MFTKPYPKISVVTPSFNQAQFLEETINSVLSQNYPNLEYIVVDGKSTDGSHEIIQKYQDRLTWVRDRDKNQTEAINKGSNYSTGDVLCYLNSDDVFLPHTLKFVGRKYAENENMMWLTGDCIIINEFGTEVDGLIRMYKRFLALTRSRSIMLVANYISQPSTFISKKLYRKVGSFNEDLNFCMDFDYWIRCSKYAWPVSYLNTPLSKFRVHSKSKGGDSFKHQFEEVEEVLKAHKAKVVVRTINRLHNKLVLMLYSKHYRKFYAE